MKAIIKTFLTILGVLFLHVAFSQEQDSLFNKPEQPKSELLLSGAVTVTTKGISTIPNLTLGKPAAIFDMSVVKGKWIFDPQFRIDLTNARPWNLMFWWRYKAIENNTWLLQVGAHPAYSFRTRTVIDNGVEKKTSTVDRYVAGEITVRRYLTENISVGTYYLYSKGLEKYITQNTHYLSLTSNFNNIRISDQVFMRISPQIYYLNMDKKGGFYATTVLTLWKKDFPLSLSSLLNKEITSDIPGSHNFLWNVSLIYSFGSAYVRK